MLNEDINLDGSHWQQASVTGFNKLDNLKESSLDELSDQRDKKTSVAYVKSSLKVECLICSPILTSSLLEDVSGC